MRAARANMPALRKAHTELLGCERGGVALPLALAG
jgi:hypothetical protein